ncbi:Lir1 domain-containing protein [Cephalotus follicularis]|uniref:Lir1 domain-containing protein n=1 Tax=Cephalotus follicularis TaxID=3775 RepID=A0A1Q3CQ24_CEPFO|nr:Lir1 domain-containing protein [Cephalotus follicularis]
MQAVLLFAPSPLPIVTHTKTLALQWRSLPRLIQTRRCPTIKATNIQDPSTVDYNSTASVFPAEACETVGGEACTVEMYPEGKLKQESSSTTVRAFNSELVDREYLEYNNPKTVFLDEACDDLGGEFCEPESQGAGS